MKKKVVIVGSVTGRCGTSALMGLLKLAGFNIGGKDSGLSSGDARNPKGFFEIKGLIRFMRSLRPRCYPSYEVPPPTINSITKIRKKYWKPFNNLLQKEFGDVFPIALKGACLLAIPLFYELRHLYDVNVVMLKRDNDSQLASAIKTGLCKDVEKYKKLRRMWFKYEREIINTYAFCKYLYIDYNDLIKNAVNTTNEITSFLNVPSIDPEKILHWIDPKLMNRKTYK